MLDGQDLRMAFIDARPEGAEKGAVVLSHGKNFFVAYWKETIAVLTKAGYRVIVQTRSAGQPSPRRGLKKRCALDGYT